MVTFPIITHDQRAVLAVAITFSVLPVIAVLLRLLAKRVSHRSLDWSDFCVIVAAVLAVALESISITGVLHAGIGYGHMKDIIIQYGPEPVSTLLKLILPLQILWGLSLSACKISVLLLCSKIFNVKIVTWCSRIIIGIIVAWATATVLLCLLICQPIAFNWDQTIPGGKCGDQVLSFTVTGIINLITDVMVLALPLPFLYQLQLPMYKKLVLLAVFSLGFLTCIISGFRINTLKSMDFTDLPYSIPLANIFSGLEPSIAVVLSCIPLMRPLLGRSHYSPTGTAKYPTLRSRSQRPHASMGKSDSRPFEQLGDDPSQYQLRPMAIKHNASIAALENASDEIILGGDDETAGDAERSAQKGLSRGITIKQEWTISTEPSKGAQNGLD